MIKLRQAQIAFLGGALLGLHEASAVAAAYAHPLILLLLGGCLLSIAIQEWQLHTCIARRVIAVAGSEARYLLAGFMLVTACASLGSSTTATAVMMLSIVSSAIAVVFLRVHYRRPMVLPGLAP